MTSDSRSVKRTHSLTALLYEYERILSLIYPRPCQMVSNTTTLGNLGLSSFLLARTVTLERVHHPYLHKATPVTCVAIVDPHLHVTRHQLVLLHTIAASFKLDKPDEVAPRSAGEHTRQPINTPTNATVSFPQHSHSTSSGPAKSTQCVALQQCSVACRLVSLPCGFDEPSERMSCVNTDGSDARQSFVPAPIRPHDILAFSTSACRAGVAARRVQSRQAAGSDLT